MNAPTSQKMNAGTVLQSLAGNSAPPLNQKVGEMNLGDDMAPDPNIEHLHALVAEFRASESETKRLRADVDRFIQEMKRQGYSYPVLAKESGFAQGTIQLIVAKDVE